MAIRLRLAWERMTIGPGAAHNTGSFAEVMIRAIFDGSPEVAACRVRTHQGAPLSNSATTLSLIVVSGTITALRGLKRYIPKTGFTKTHT